MDYFTLLGFGLLGCGVGGVGGLLGLVLLWGRSYWLGCLDLVVLVIQKMMVLIVHNLLLLLSWLLNLVS